MSLQVGMFCPHCKTFDGYTTVPYPVKENLKIVMDKTKGKISSWRGTRIPGYLQVCQGCLGRHKIEFVHGESPGLTELYEEENEN